MYASVLVELPIKKIDKCFTYIVPKEFEEKIKVGIRVKVNFNNMLLEGFVLNIFKEYKEKYELKQIVSLVDKEPVLNKELLLLGKEIANYTLCTLISAYQVMLPKALKAKNNVNLKIKNNRYLVLNKEKEDIKNYINQVKSKKTSIKQIELLESLLKEDNIKITSLNSTINTLMKKELIKIIYEEEYRYKNQKISNDKLVILNEEQQNVVNEVTNNLNKQQTYLLYGVTGSGKTEVYMNIISKVLGNGKEAIVLVPEISLTPQIVDRFINRFGNNVAILHSGLSDGERYDEYRKIKENKVKIVVGARSAVFAPFENLGIIIIDEEHSQTYKQENHPRYNAKDIAIMRSKYHNCPVLLGSATPTLESFAKACNKKYKLLTMQKRAGNSKLPIVHIIDMKEEVKKNNFVISSMLKEKINDRLKKGEQIILLLNRRGYSSLLTCSNCGNIEKCPNCDISLTYHKYKNKLKCHYCNYEKINQNICPICKSTDIKDYGLGTEKLEEELNLMFNNAKVIRMDVDTTNKKGAHQKIINDFSNHKYDILVGTQMIAKGLDFPLVTLVGVVNADSSLNVPDFRSSERTFQLLSQVAGRAGRGNNPGEVIIQCYNTDHYSIKLSKEHNYLKFYQEEMKIRKLLSYSPYYYMIVVKIYSKDYDEVSKEATKVGDFLRKNVEKDTVILGPTTANVFKINNIYNFQCIIKLKKDKKLRSILLKLDEIYKTNNKVNIEIDVDPVRV